MNSTDQKDSLISLLKACNPHWTASFPFNKFSRWSLDLVLQYDRMAFASALNEAKENLTLFSNYKNTFTYSFLI